MRGLWRCSLKVDVLVEAEPVCNFGETCGPTANQEAMYSMSERVTVLVDTAENLSGQHDLNHLSWSCFPGSGDRQAIKVTLLLTCSHQPSIHWRHSRHLMVDHFCNNKWAFHDIYSKFAISLYAHLRCFMCLFVCYCRIRANVQNVLNKWHKIKSDVATIELTSLLCAVTPKRTAHIVAFVNHSRPT